MACSSSSTMPCRCAARLEAMLEAMDSRHIPRRVKMWEGICSACGAEGATFAYLRAAARPRVASSVLSQAWMM